MLLNNKTMQDFVENNPKLIKRRQSVRYPSLYVLKYTEKVFYDGLWNHILENARGTIVDEDYNPVVMPFKKIYNRMENGQDIPRDNECTAIRKMNGFMAAVTYNEKLDDVLVSTTGSLDSVFVDMANDYITTYVKDMIRNLPRLTYLFEICHPKDPHIIAETHGAYLIGAREVKWDGAEIADQMQLDTIATSLGVMRPVWFDTRFSDVVIRAKEALHEGYVVRDKTTGLIIKLKSPHYLVKKFLARIREKKFEEFCRNPQNFKQNIDEEFYPLINFIVANKDEFIKLEEQDRLRFIGHFFRETAPNAQEPQ